MTACTVRTFSLFLATVLVTPALAQIPDNPNVGVKAPPTSPTLSDLGRSLRNYFTEDELNLLFQYMRDSVLAAFKGEEVSLPPDLAFKLEVLLARMKREGGHYMENLMRQLEKDLERNLKEKLREKMAEPPPTVPAVRPPALFPLFPPPPLLPLPLPQPPPAQAHPAAPGYAPPAGFPPASGHPPAAPWGVQPPLPPSSPAAPAQDYQPPPWPFQLLHLLQQPFLQQNP